MNLINDMLSDWLLQALNTAEFEVSQIACDASPRQYYRINTTFDSSILMIVPGNKADFDSMENFIAIAELLSAKNIVVPIILSRAPNGQGLLLSDLGDTQYLKVLNEDSADDLYRDALDVLFNLQKRIPKNVKHYDKVSLPIMNDEFMHHQIEQLFWGWFLNQFLNLRFPQKEQGVFEECINSVIEAVEQQPKVLTHLDFHSRNIMYRQNQDPGILDFQDAMWGPVTYDLASLFHDCYISWPESSVESWLKRYYVRLINTDLILFDYQKPSYNEFLKWFHYAALQRHLKNLGIFARLHLRDHKTSYLHDIPTVLKNIVFICSKYSELSTVERLFTSTIIPVFEETFASSVLEQPCEP